MNVCGVVWAIGAMEIVSVCGTPSHGAWPWVAIVCMGVFLLADTALAGVAVVRAVEKKVE